LGSNDVLIEIDEVNVSEKGSDNDFDINLPPTKKTKVNYNHIHKFQIKCVAKLNWAKGALGKGSVGSRWNTSQCKVQGV
jgi:hypothetical protein